MLKSLALTGVAIAALMAANVQAKDPDLTPTAARTWTADNGNGTFTNPILQDEFSDPDIIRVGEDYYMVGSTMHVMPGLPILHSRDLVNWEFVSYAFNRIDFGPEYHFEGGKDAYGNGIWAPCLRYHDGTFYIFVNVNGYGMQVYTSKSPAGPWTHKALGGKIYDLSVLFDDDGHIYAVHGYDEVRMIEIKPDLSGYVEGSERVIIPAGNAMGEGHHIYKIKGKYYIISANYAPVGRMQAARADTPFGPYETAMISARETMGTQRGWWTTNVGFWGPIPANEPLNIVPSGENDFGAVPLHQGGIVDLPNGDWWGFSMSDQKSAGRMTFLSPVTWKDGWPYFGLEGNLGRSPRTWLKPNTGAQVPPTPTYQRDDDFSSQTLLPIWQWNHVPVDNKWSLKEKPGVLRLHTLPADGFFTARNTLTQRSIGPESTASVQLDGRQLRVGDVAGLGLLDVPFYWIGIARTEEGYRLRTFNQVTGKTEDRPLVSPVVTLRAAGNYDTDSAALSFSTDGKTFVNIAENLRLAYQMKTFQGVRYALFAYNAAGTAGGFADFDTFRVDEPLADRSHNIPVGKVISITNLANGQEAWANPHGMLHFTWNGSKEWDGPGTRFRVHDKGQGRVSLEAMDGSGFLTVVGAGLPADVRLMKTETADSLFQWQDMLRNQFMLLSVKTNRYVGLNPKTGEPYSADWPGAEPDRKDGSVLVWQDTSPAP